MFELYKAQNLLNSLQFKNDGINAKVILKNNDSLALFVAIKENQLIAEHVSLTEAFIFVLQGKVSYITPKENKKEVYEINEGEIFMFNKNEKHEVKGLIDSKILVIRI